MALKAQILNSSKWNVISVVFNSIQQILRVVVLSRFLSTEDFGMMAIALAVVSFTEIFADLGFTVPIIHKQSITAVQYSSIFWMNIILSVIITFSLFFIAPVVSFLYKEPELITIIRYLSFIVVINAFGKIFQSIKIKELQFKFISIVSIVSSIIGFVIIMLLSIAGFGIYSLVWGTITQTVIRQLFYLLSGLNSLRISLHLNLKEINDFIRIGSYQVGAQFFDFLSNKVDVFILGHILGMESLGIYNLAKELILRVYGLFVSLSRNIASAALAKLQNDMKILISGFSQYSFVYAFLVIPVFAMLFFFSYEICVIMYGEKAILIESSLKILAIYGLFLSFIAPTASLMIALGKTHFSLKWTVVSSIINVIIVTISGYVGYQMVLYAQILVSIILYVLNWRMIVMKLLQLTFKEYLSIHYKLMIYGVLLFLIFIGINSLFNLNLLSKIFCYFSLLIFYGWYVIRKNPFLFSYIHSILLKK